MESKSIGSDILNLIKGECEVKGKELFMPIRVAIIGQPHGAELKMLIPLLNKKVLGLVKNDPYCFQCGMTFPEGFWREKDGYLYRIQSK